MPKPKPPILERWKVSQGSAAVSASLARPSSWDGRLAVVLGHGAGSSMDSPFMNFFHEGLAVRGILAVKFNFPYMEEGRKTPDPRPVLESCYHAVLNQMCTKLPQPPRSLYVGGKSLGGRIASYVAAREDRVSGLVFLGYPLHPPGRIGALRDSHLYEIQKPMLFVSGTRDALARADLLRSVVDRLPLAHLHWIQGGNHSLELGKGDAVRAWSMALEALMAWLG
ncbi:MAG: alpha/beta fold hydrolase [Acidobacteria bacterium]|nr:alpha/beta fold hydrolase [Acidobacteriota bacterium]